MAAAFGQRVRLAADHYFRRLYARLFPPYTMRSLLVRRWLLSPIRGRSSTTHPEIHSKGVGAALPPLGSILWVLHDGPGGVGHASADLAEVLSDRWSSWMLLADPHRLYLEKVEGPGKRLKVRTWWLKKPWNAATLHSPAMRTVYEQALDLVRPDVIHVRHLLGHTLDIAELCAENNLPAILSLHDFYLVCPSIHLIDDNIRHCAGACTPSKGRCLTPLPWLQNIPMIKGTFLENWRQSMAEAFPAWKVIVTASPSTRDLVMKVYPQLANSDLRVIEHGRDLERARTVATVPTPGGQIRILVAGHLSIHKGSLFIRSLAELDAARAGRIHFDFLGSIDRNLAGVGCFHGPYDRHELLEICSELRPSFAGIFSICSETYSHVLTEAWALGIPILATNLGAQADRVEAYGGGWTIPVDDLETAYKQILSAADDIAEYKRRQRMAEAAPLVSLREMAISYAEIYSDLIKKRPYGRA